MISETEALCALHMTPLSPNEMALFGLKLFLTVGSQPVSSSPALCACFNQVRPFCNVAGCDKEPFQEGAFPPKPQRQTGNISWQNLRNQESLFRALWCAQDSFWGVINTDSPGVAVRTGS